MLRVARPRPYLITDLRFTTEGLVGEHLPRHPIARRRVAHSNRLISNARMRSARTADDYVIRKERAKLSLTKDRCFVSQVLGATLGLWVMRAPGIQSFQSDGDQRGSGCSSSGRAHLTMAVTQRIGASSTAISSRERTLSSVALSGQYSGSSIWTVARIPRPSTWLSSESWASSSSISYRRL